MKVNSLIDRQKVTVCVSAMRAEHINKLHKIELDRINHRLLASSIQLRRQAAVLRLVQHTFRGPHSNKQTGIKPYERPYLGSSRRTARLLCRLDA